MKRCAVFGHPIGHSLSPRIHAAFADELGIALRYEAIDAPPEHFARALAAFAQAGGIGANVTLPLKEAALALATSASGRARLCGAANTLVRDGEHWHADNTDGTGLVRDLTVRHGLHLQGRRVLLLGAGGAARGVAPALLDAGIAELVVANRSPARADALVSALGQPGRTRAHGLDALSALGGFELVINATSATRGSRLPSLPDTLLSRYCVAVDLNYGDAAAPFLAWARDRQAQAGIDGLGMLVEQAAESFALWHGVRPDGDRVHAMLRNALA